MRIFHQPGNLFCQCIKFGAAIETVQEIFGHQLIGFFRKMRLMGSLHANFLPGLYILQTAQNVRSGMITQLIIML